jgi:N-acetylglucosaminyldiphosphoundecaprenol N-acetyl-beta-D-mannosaminyltransferase
MMVNSEFEDFVVCNGRPDFNAVLNYGGGTISCINMHAYVLSKENPIFKESLLNSRLVLCDGIAISVVSLFKYGRWLRRYDGPFFHQDLLDFTRAKKLNIRVLYFGSTHGTLAGIKKRIEREYSNLDVSVYSPDFKDEFTDLDFEKHQMQINLYKPDIIFVGMTAPKQEIWSNKMSSNNKETLFINIGAEFDFFAGTVKRHPSWVAQIGLLWLYRLIKQPRKIYKRVFISGSKYILYQLKLK